MSVESVEIDGISLLGCSGLLELSQVLVLEPGLHLDRYMCGLLTWPLLNHQPLEALLLHLDLIHHILSVSIVLVHENALAVTSQAVRRVMSTAAKRRKATIRL